MTDQETFAEFDAVFRRWLTTQKGTNQGTVDDELVEPVLTIAEFCAMQKISRSHYHKEKRAGRGPREIHSGHRILITASAVRDWRQRGEQVGGAQNKAA